MAIYHLSITTVGRAGGALPRSAHHTGGVVKTAGALGKASYLAGKRLVDRDGRVVDYRSKAEGVEYVASCPAAAASIQRPCGAPPTTTPQ